MAGPRPTDNLRIPLIKTHHKSPYPSISPARPELSQVGKTVLIAGGSAGIGFAIARAFVQAKASRVILLGRRRDVLEASAAKLAAEVADKMSTTVEGRVCDISNLNDTARLWENLQRESIFVDVLVLNAAVTGKLGPILSHALADTWSAFEVNVRTILDFTGHFYGQDGEAGRQKVCQTEPSIHQRQAGRQAGRPTCLCTTLTLCSGTTVSHQRLHFRNPQSKHRIRLDSRLRTHQKRRNSSPPANCPGHRPGQNAGCQLPPWRGQDGTCCYEQRP